MLDQAGAAVYGLEQAQLERSRASSPTLRFPGYSAGLVSDNNPYANPYANPHAPPGPQPGLGYNPYTPPSVGAQGPNWAQAIAQPLASPGTRLGAAFLDGFLFGGIAIVSMILDAIIGSAALTGGSMALGALALMVYQWHLLSTTGQSLGKKWTGIRIVKVDGSPVDFVSAVLLRSWVLGVVGALLPFVTLIDVLMIFSEEHRCLHDHIASTKVIIA